MSGGGPLLRQRGYGLAAGRFHGKLCTFQNVKTRSKPPPDQATERPRMAHREQWLAGLLLGLIACAACRQVPIKVQPGLPCCQHAGSRSFAPALPEAGSSQPGK